MKKLLLIFLVFFASSHALNEVATSQWYPSSGPELNAALDEHDRFAAQNYAASVAPHSVRVIIAPHAGIQYSGAVAAAVYRLINPQTKRIIILAPDHSGKYPHVSVSSNTQFAVPNGFIKADSKLSLQLAKHPLFAMRNALFESEHAFDNQLPFIARYAPHATIIPLIVGPIDCGQAAQVAAVLKKQITKQTVVVVSTDFVHYGSRYEFTPFEDHQQLRVQHLNSQAINLIESGRCQEFQNFMHRSRATICGANAIKVLLALLQENAFGLVEPRLVAYDSSSKNDHDDFVTYVGMLFTTESLSRKPIADQLTQQEQRGLLRQASDVLDHMFDVDFDATLYNPITSFGVTRPLGAFTTLRTPDGALRGCIGRIVSDQPLYKTIAIVTQDTAVKDSRFAPVTKKEVPSLDLKLSVLSAPVPISNYQQIKLGTHGIILSRNGKSAVYLPTVATDQGWDLEQTLSQLSQKAGLGADAWKEKSTQFKVFSSLDFPDDSTLPN